VKSNGLLKWLLIPLVLLVVFVGIRLFSSRSPSTTQSGREAVDQLTAEEMRSLGIEADTPRDTVATLVAQVKELRAELKTALDDNKQQMTENQRLRQREGAIDQRIQSALETERDRVREEREQAAREQEQTRNVVQELQQRLDGLGSANEHADLPVGLGLREDDSDALGGVTRMQWVEPEDAAPADSKKRTSGPSQVGAALYPTGLAPAVQDAHDSTERGTDAAEHEFKQADSIRPVYTVPSDSTLMGSIAMTALIGRVPIDGTVNDPYPFKVLIGAENLTANGIKLPDLAGAIVSGTASGDWTLSCVRGQIRSMTLVFHDGTIRTTTSGASSNANAAGALHGGLGWISDPHGIPCVSGERRSNAQQYLTSQSLITAAGAGAASFIESDGSSVSYLSSSDGSLGTVGISGNEAMGRILAAGVQDMSQWVNKLYGQAFAAIYVRPGAEVAVHIDQPLAIDYDSAGRKVDHLIGVNHVSSLD
jgi:integrating conjugative element protein (TIGR03752 family)